MISGGWTIVLWTNSPMKITMIPMWKPCSQRPLDMFVTFFPSSKAGVTGRNYSFCLDLLDWFLLESVLCFCFTLWLFVARRSGLLVIFHGDIDEITWSTPHLVHEYLWQLYPMTVKCTYYHNVIWSQHGIDDSIRYRAMITCSVILKSGGKQQTTWLITFGSRCPHNYFTACDPHQDIYTFCYGQIFWHSIWHIFWHSIWHSIWHTFWHSTWHIFWHMFWHIFWHSIWHSIWHIFWHIFWHPIWPFYLANLLAFYLTYLLALYLAYLLAFYLGYLLAFYLAYLLTSYLAILSDMLSGVLSGISSGILSGRWGTAVLTELGRSQVEVQRFSLSSAGPRLRSSGAHWARKVRGWGPAVLTELGGPQVEVQRCSVRSDPCSWGPAVPTACGSWRRACRRVGKAEVDMEVKAEVVEENEEEEKKEEEEKEKNNSDKI